MSSQNVITPLPVLLAALDRLDLDPPTAALARDLAVVCHDEGRDVSAQALASAASAQKAPGEAQAELTDVLRPQWDRPVSLSDRLSQLSGIRRLCRVTGGMMWGGNLAWGIAMVLLGTQCIPQFLRLPWAYFMLAGLVCSLISLPNYDWHRRRKAQLTEHVPSDEEHALWAKSDLARAYLRAHVSTDLPIMNGDVPFLNQLVEDDLRAQKISSTRSLLSTQV